MKTTHLQSSYFGSISGISPIALAASAVVMNHHPGHLQDAGSDLYLGPADGNMGGGASGEPTRVDSMKLGDDGKPFNGTATGEAGVASGHISQAELDQIQANSSNAGDAGTDFDDDPAPSNDIDDGDHHLGKAAD